MMTMAWIAWYKPLVLAGAPMIFWMFALWRVSRAIIISVRRMLSETEMEKYGRPKLIAAEFQMLLSGCEVWKMSAIPIAVSVMSAESIAVGL